MKKPSIAPALSICARNRDWRTAHGGTQQDWADAETRAFLERPASATSFANVMRVILITAMVVAAAKMAWIIAFHVR
jgi:hypothetical protein